jgi:2-aminobenzoate-CoA ligase
MYTSAHLDTFAADRLPPRELWPELIFDRPSLQFPDRLNCASRLLDDAIAEGYGAQPALLFGDVILSYEALLADANRIANVLIRDMGVVPGNRVLLRSANNPTLIAAWLAVMKVGAIAVTTMPMLRARELEVIAERAQVSHALCDVRLADDLKSAASSLSGRGTTGGLLQSILMFGNGELERAMQAQSPSFHNVDTAAEDVCLLAFTSGTTGIPKATMHFHRDILVMAEVVGRELLGLTDKDRCVGSPPIGFTFGLGALLVFPLHARAASVLIEQPSPQALLDATERHQATCLLTAPTQYRSMLPLLPGRKLDSLRQCVSAGEPLPLSTWERWQQATGIRLIDGIGATEMIHIFISAKGEDIRPGATGKPLPGYTACVLGDDGEPLPVGSSGRLAVKGPTGCRYLDDPRQRDYVVNGWNLTGDRYRVDADGYFWFEARADDMIISSGYNIAGPEVEAALLAHPAVRECAVIGAPDDSRGFIVKAFVVVATDCEASPVLVKELQDFVKKTIAPYKYPRAVEFVDALPKTSTGKVQRNVLRQREKGGTT